MVRAGSIDRPHHDRREREPEMSAERIIEDEVPMLTDVLAQIGIHDADEALDVAALVGPFADWLGQQHVRPEERGFVGALVGAFVSQYLVRERAATRRIVGRVIYLDVPVASGVAREIEPYRFGWDLAGGQGDAAQALRVMCS